MIKLNNQVENVHLAHRDIMKQVFCLPKKNYFCFCENSNQRALLMSGQDTQCEDVSNQTPPHVLEDMFSHTQGFV